MTLDTRLSPCALLRAIILTILHCAVFLPPGASAQTFDHGILYDLTEIAYDHSDPPSPRIALRPRQDASSATPSSTFASVASTAAVQTSSPLATSLPHPFDSSLGNNFTSPTCPQFFHSFLSLQEFQQCLPLSLLLQTSNSFFVASRSLVQLDQTLDAVCGASFTQCSGLMSNLANQIMSDSNCGQDLQMQNPLVLQAYNGFIAYPTLYQAGCLKDDTGDYCYANAVMNASAASSYYLYYLPLGVQLPGGSVPSCNRCLQNTMAIFATAAANSSVPLHMDYTAAAQMIDMNCGPSFVDATVHTSSAGPAAHLGRPSVAGLIGLLALPIFLLLL